MKKGLSLRETLGIVVVIIVIFSFSWAVISKYPAIHPVIQGATEVFPLELLDGQKAHFTLKNRGEAAVLITVNFSSDGSILFKNDKGQIADSFEVPPVVLEQNQLTDFTFTPIFNETLKNATIIVCYRSNIERIPYLKPFHLDNCYQAVYEKTNRCTSVDSRIVSIWKLQ
jgi:hypothetical protein